MNTSHPVSLSIAPPVARGRIHVLIRLVLLAGLATIGCSSLYWLLYLTVPAIVALLVAQKSGSAYLASDGPRVARGLAWLADVYAYLWLLTDRWPAGEHTVELHVEASGEPTTSSALLRLLYSLPALILLSLASFVGAFMWIVGAIAILISARLPDFVASYLQLVLAYRLRLFAYHASLVREYPSFGETLVARTA